MAYENHNSGALFRNKERRTDKHPSHTGTIDVDGVSYRLAGWANVSKSGVSYLSIKLTRADDQPKSGVAKGKSIPDPVFDEEDDIPF